MLIFPLFIHVHVFHSRCWVVRWFGPVLDSDGWRALSEEHICQFRGPFTVCPDETSTFRTHSQGRNAHHLGNAEAVLEVVEGDVVVVPVDLEQEVLQHLGLDVEARREIQVRVHDLQEHHDLRILPLPTQTYTQECIQWVQWWNKGFGLTVLCLEILEKKQQTSSG